MAKASALVRAADIFDKVIDLAEARSRNLPLYQHLQFVSLGLNCMARTLPTRWGLKPPKKLGELTGPFDITLYTPQALERTIASDFAGYANPENLRYNAEMNYCEDPTSEIAFVHENGEEFVVNEFAKLRSTYDARIERFRAMLDDQRPTFLVVSYPPIFGAYQELVDGLIATLERVKTWRQAPTAMYCFRILMPDQQPEVADFNRDDFEWFNIEMPTAEYEWHIPEHYLTDAGMTFERTIITGLTRMVHRLGY